LTFSREIGETGAKLSASKFVAMHLFRRIESRKSETTRVIVLRNVLRGLLGFGGSARSNRRMREGSQLLALNREDKISTDSMVRKLKARVFYQIEIV